MSELTAVTVEVTPEDIANGQPGNCGLCPVALAVHRIVADGTDIRVGMETVSWETASAFGSADMPWKATEFILAFDRNDPAVPFRFEIELPDELIRLAVSQ